jgi:hypothetical protein
MTASAISEPVHIGAPLHTCEQFAFTAHAPVDVTWPLFGADKERVWAARLVPGFCLAPERRRPGGMVFKVSRGDKTAVWVNTALDRTANDLVREMAAQDRGAGREWDLQINTYLRQER